MKEASTIRATVVARDAELAAVREALGGGAGLRGAVLGGEAGIGKTTLWEAGVAFAAGEGFRVLSARPAEAEARLSLAAVADLLEAMGEEELAGLPAPQRRALEVALLRVDPGTRPAEPRSVAAALLGLIRLVAARQRVLIAIDDVQWLDPASAGALAFAARRLRDEDVAVLLAARPGGRSPLEQALGDRLARIDVGALSLGASRRLLAERLGLSLPRRTLQRLVAATGGNPLFMLEVGRMLDAAGPAALGEELPVPDGIDDLVGIRVGALPAHVRRVLLAVALSGDLAVAQLEALAGPETVEEAFATGVLFADRDRARASHPLLAAAARSRATPRERRRLHLDLAAVVEDGELEARHRALASVAPDEALAHTLGAAARLAAARGAAEDAVELAEHALRLTPDGSPEQPERLIALAKHLMVSGERERAGNLLAPELDRIPPGRARARAHLLLAERRSDLAHVDETGHHLERALAESAGDPVLHALAAARRVRDVAVACVERIPEAEEWALEAVEATRGAGAEVEREALHALAWTRVLRGLPLDDIASRFDEISGSAFEIVRSVERIAADRMLLRGDVRGARERLRALLEQADERGELWSYVVVRLQLCELELRAGMWAVAEELLDEWNESTERGHMADRAYERCRAHLALGRGLAAEAERWAARASARMTSKRFTWHVLETKRAQGGAALLARRPEQAAEVLGSVWAHTEREGVDEPAAFPVAPDLVEALVETGRLDEAAGVSDRLARLAREQEHPWAIATAARCRAIACLAARRDIDRATVSLHRAAGSYAEMGLELDAARSLLALGRWLRRNRRWRGARESLEAAAAGFDRLGSPGWAEDARSDLERVGGRRPRARGDLTPAEHRVVRLAMDGLSNKEIAVQLVVTVHTVESHLKRAYAKLGVRSRAQLAHAEAE